MSEEQLTKWLVLGLEWHGRPTLQGEMGDAIVALVAEVRRLREHIHFSHGGHSFHYDDCTIDLCGKVNRDRD
jgi:hypothetical protein